MYKVISKTRNIKVHHHTPRVKDPVSYSVKNE